MATTDSQTFVSWEWHGLSSFPIKTLDLFDIYPLSFSFQRKKFEIRAVGCPESRKFTYYTSSDDKSKHLLYLCRVTHQFSMAMQPKLAELRKLEEEGKRKSTHSEMPTVFQLISS